MENQAGKKETHELRPVIAGNQSFRLVVKPGDNSLSARDFWSIIAVCALGGMMMIVVTAIAVL